MSPEACSILLVEDEPMILRLAVIALEAGGFTRISTHTRIATARDAWYSNERRFDLLLTDFSLPDESAIEFINELCEAKPELAVLIMTGFSKEALPLDHLMTRTVEVLEKPFRPMELRAAVLKHLPRFSLA